MPGIFFTIRVVKTKNVDDMLAFFSVVRAINSYQVYFTTTKL